ncbi:MAG: MBL fold metallo-hydrolase [Myxococcota bacterium]|nr:MBL fold metallo-hydrolase [Myxococcota bacterium]
MTSYKRSACAVLMRPATGAEPYQVYIVRRSTSLSFLGGYQAFPGGTVDPVDHEITVKGMHDDLDMVSAAVRELFEETGVLCLDGADKLDAGECARMRETLLEGSAPWPKFLERHNLTLNASRFHHLGRWVTPPYTPTRYEAIYLAMWLPEGQEPSIIEGELTEGEWLTPTEALRRHNGGEAQITYPVLETLRAMVHFKGDLEAVSRRMGERTDGAYARPGGEILTGAHVVPVKTFTLPPATHTNTYVLGTDELVVIDPATPIPEEQEKLVDYLQYLQSEGGTLKEIWLTHEHQDHVGAVNRIRDTFQIPVAAHRDTASRLPEDIPVDRFIETDDVLVLSNSRGDDFRWRAIHTPGHARGHLVFFEEKLGTLISGDLIVGLGTVLIAPPEGNMIQYFNSLEYLQTLPLGFTLPAPGPPIAASKAKIEEYIAHRTMRETKIFEALSEPLGSMDIVKKVYTDVPPQVYPLAEINVKAHLEKLLEEGRVSVDKAIYSQVHA